MGDVILQISHWAWLTVPYKLRNFSASISRNECGLVVGGGWCRLLIVGVPANTHEFTVINPSSSTSHHHPTLRSPTSKFGLPAGLWSGSSPLKLHVIWPEKFEWTLQMGSTTQVPNYARPRRLPHRHSEWDGRASHSPIWDRSVHGHGRFTVGDFSGPL